jgi:hypothetical protein
MSKLEQLSGELTIDLQTGLVVNSAGKVVFSIPFAVVSEYTPEMLSEDPNLLAKLNLAISAERAKGYPQRQKVFDRITSALQACEDFEEPEEDLAAIAEASYRFGVALVANAIALAVEREESWDRWVDHVHPKALEFLPSDVSLFQQVQKDAREMADDWTNTNPTT